MNATSLHEMPIHEPRPAPGPDGYSLPEVLAQLTRDGKSDVFRAEFQDLTRHLIRTGSLHHLGTVRDAPADSLALPHIEKVAGLAVALLDTGLLRQLMLQVVEFYAEDLATARNPRKFLTEAIEDFTTRLFDKAEQVRA